MSLALLLLAAGRSERFGPNDKLLAPVNGRPLVLASLKALSRPRVTRRLVVVSSTEVASLCERAGCQTLMLPRGLGQGDSLSAGVRMLRGSVTRLLIGLADMPWLPPNAVDTLLDTDADDPACVSAGDVPMPPAVFPADWLPRLAQISGDRGAGGLLKTLPPRSMVRLPPAWLGDIDYASDL